MPTLERISVPSYVIDREGRLRWVNQAARRLLGDVVGRDFTESVAPTHRPNARKQFARKLHGTPVTDFEAELLDSEGRLVRAHVSSVPLQDGRRVVAVFGLLQPREICSARALRPTRSSPRSTSAARRFATTCA